MAGISFSFFIPRDGKSSWAATLTEAGFELIENRERRPNINYDAFVFIGSVRSDLGEHRIDVQHWFEDGLLLTVYFNKKSDREVIEARIGPLFPVPVPHNPKYAT